MWFISYEGTGAQLVELKGFQDIAFLLGQPNEAVHCIELMGGTEVTMSRHEQLDNQAKREYRERIEELQRTGKFSEGDSPFGLPKVRVLKVKKRAKKKKKKEDEDK